MTDKDALNKRRIEVYLEYVKYFSILVRVKVGTDTFYAIVPENYTNFQIAYNLAEYDLGDVKADTYQKLRSEFASITVIMGNVIIERWNTFTIPTDDLRVIPFCMADFSKMDNWIDPTVQEICDLYVELEDDV
jgi:hypothetical protein